MRPLLLRFAVRPMFAALTVFALGSAAAAWTAAEFHARSLDRLRQHQYDEALADFTEAIRLDSKVRGRPTSAVAGCGA